MRSLIRFAVPVVLFGLSWAGQARAGLIGTTVAGVLNFNVNLQNEFDPGNGLVPAGYLNKKGPTVTIAEPAIEFGFGDGSNTITANFTDDQLIVKDLTPNNGFYNSTFTFKFTDKAFLGSTLVAESFPNGLTSSIAGDVISIVMSGGYRTTGQTYSAVFDISSPPSVPEPSSLALCGIAGAIGPAVARARRRRGSPTQDSGLKG